MARSFRGPSPGEDSGDDAEDGKTGATPSLPVPAAAASPEPLEEGDRLEAAVALENAGELQAAARLFEHAGEHAQAAHLRLEHATTLRDERRRLTALREACAHAIGRGPAERALHERLGESLMRLAKRVGPGGQRRSLELEAAQAFERAQRGDLAGEIFEHLGQWSRAAKAYEQAGEVTRLELVLELIEHNERRERDLEELRQQAETAWSAGQRELALRAARAHISERKQQDRPADPQLVALAQRAHAARFTRPSFHLHINSPTDLSHSFHLVMEPRFTIGRAHEADFRVDAPTISREHLRLELADPPGRADLTVQDLGSKAGSFFDGLPLDPGEPSVLEAGGELALGMAAPMDLSVQTDETTPIASIEDQSDGIVHVFAPLGLHLGQLLDAAPDLRLSFAAGLVKAECGVEWRAWLGDTPLGLRARAELAAGDELQLRPRDERASSPPWRLRLLTLGRWP